ncbi:MAG: polyprenyl synthetase family protein [Acidobacteriota bacterium]|nr:polyprenyl synthetase family protein [Acidobacteriota bacterium]
MLLQREFDIARYLKGHRRRVEARLADLPLSGAERKTVALKALKYALETTGKRFRPLLTIAAADVYRRGDDPLILDCAAAVECIHTASLIFDDLPCMDDAVMRRGRETPHRIFGEGQAVLAGMSLIAEANRLITRFPGTRKSMLRKKLACLDVLNAAFDLGGLSGGQSDDLLNRTDLTVEEVEYIHAKKTGSLFIACVELAAILCDAPEAERRMLVAYAKNLGLAFQIRDDLLDVDETADTGKDHGLDSGKTTFVDLAGVEKCRRLYEDLMDVSLKNLEPFGNAAQHLVQLTHVIRKRVS